MCIHAYVYMCIYIYIFIFIYAYIGRVLHELLRVVKNLLVGVERGPFEHFVGNPGIVAWKNVARDHHGKGFEARAFDSGLSGACRSFPDWPCWPYPKGCFFMMLKKGAN